MQRTTTLVSGSLFLGRQPLWRNTSQLFLLGSNRWLTSQSPTLGSLSTATAFPGSLPISEPTSQTTKVERTLRRFWKTVGIKFDPEAQTYAVLLDSRSLKTPAGTKLALPADKLAVALLIANEWENQDTVLKAFSLPITSLASRALDSLQTESARHDLLSQLVKFFNTDTICFHETEPPALVALQKAHWDPLIQWANEKYNVKINIFDGILGTSQSNETRDRFLELAKEWDGWKMAAFERAVLSSKSFIISLALVEGHLSVEDAALATHVEVQSQIERWGEVEDTHDVDHQDIRGRLGAAAALLMNHPSK